ncbi:MAG: NUDIX hydrolase [Clostridia bacterium]|nr:NUDIX hydrolase [Clostridia bacterium]
MLYEEKTVSSEKIFNGRIINLKVDTVKLPNGTTATRELVEHPGGVAVVPVDENGFVYLVRQFRKPYEEFVLEIPAGKRDKGEDALIGAKRELSEETGLFAETFIDLGKFYPTPGYVDEIIYIYLALGLKKGKAHPDEDEFVEIEKIHINELCNMIMKNEIKDGKTIAGILKAKIYLERWNVKIVQNAKRHD